MKQATRFTKLALLLIVAGVLALALAGCGGDDGLSAADQARIDAAEEAARLAAEQAAAEEAARLAAEEAARLAAEEAAAEEAARLAAEEAARLAAEEAAAEEAARLAAEEAARQAAQAEADRMARIESARMAIAAAATAEAAQAAYDAVKDEATPTEAAALMQAVMDRTAALAMMDRATQQMMALAAAAVDVTTFDLTTEAGIAAAEAALAALQAALDAAMDVSDADKAMYQSQLNAASLPVMAARAESDRMGRIQAAMNAIAMAATAADAEAAYDMVKDEATLTEGQALRMAIQARVDQLAMMDRAAAQMSALMMAAGNIDLSDLSTQAAVNAAETAIGALEAAIAGAADVSDADKATYQATVDAAKTAVMTAQGALDHAAQTMVLANAVMDLQAIDLGNLSTQAAIDAANSAIEALEMALEAATELSAAEKAAALVELATAKRTVMMAQGRVDVAGQMAALSTAYMALNAIDLNDLMTQAQIDAANAAIVALDLALEGATDLTAAQKLDATVAVTLAKRSVAAAQTALNSNLNAQKMALSTAGTALGEIDLTDLSTQAKIDAANAAIKTLQMALDDATHVSAADKAMYQTQLNTATETVRTAQTGMDSSGRMMAQRTALTTAMADARKYVGMVNDTASDADVTAADNAIAALKKAIADAVDLPAGDTDVAIAQGTLTTLEGLLASAKTSRMTAMAEAEKTRNEMMAATAAKLHAGISMPTATDTDTADTDTATGTRFARYVDATDDATDITAGDASLGQLRVSRSDQDVYLSADKETIADNHGWEGKRYTRTRPASEGMYEAIVYSNVEDPTQGRKFGSATPGSGDARAFEYTLDANGILVADEADGVGATDDAFVSMRVAGSSFDHTAGVKEFPLPDPSPGGATRVTIAGSYHGVSGNYVCTPGADNTCAVQVAAEGFNLGGTVDATNAFAAANATWTFKPGDPNARVMDVEDTIYASYGWWIHKAANDGDFTASAFVALMGDVPDAAGLNGLNGTAKYMGGAAGKYALISTTGGTNDAGHFTARAMLEADFTNNTDATAITGTIDMFIGADGEARDWSVKLNGSTIGETGVIGDATDGTEWTIDGTAAADSGNWTGALRDNGDDGVPQIGTGTFYSEYGSAGKMVGAFGVNKQ